MYETGLGECGEQNSAAHCLTAMEHGYTLIVSFLEFEVAGAFLASALKRYFGAVHGAGREAGRVRTRTGGRCAHVWTEARRASACGVL